MISNFYIGIPKQRELAMVRGLVKVTVIIMIPGLFLVGVGVGWVVGGDRKDLNISFLG